MPSLYTPDPTAAQPPSAAPSLSDAVVPQLLLPVDADTFNAAAFLQAYKALADWLLFVKRRLAEFCGIRIWSGATTYAAGDIAYRSGQVYLSMLGDNTNQTPPAWPDTETLYWKRISFSKGDIADIGGNVISASSGWECSHGATISEVVMRSLGSAAVRDITFRVQGVPKDSYTDIDLNGATTKLTDHVIAIQTSINRAGFWGNLIVGADANVGGDKNVLRVWYAGNDDNAPGTVDISVTITGV